MLQNTNEFSACDSRLFTFWMDENGCLCLLVKDAIRTLESYKLSFDLIRLLTNGRKVCLFADMNESSLILVNDRAKEYMAQELPLLFNAVAILTHSTLQKVAPTIFLNTMGEPVPIRMFESECEAKEWLQQYA